MDRWLWAHKYADATPAKYPEFLYYFDQESFNFVQNRDSVMAWILHDYIITLKLHCEVKAWSQAGGAVER